jgi:hypothetical protein
MENMPLKNSSTKPFSRQEIYAETLQHLIWMAGQKGAKQYAWHRAKELDSDISGLWVGIKDDLIKNMKEINGLHRN